MKMPHGKYQGEELEQIPSEYLRWVAANWDEDELATAADQEYNERDTYEEHFYKVLRRNL